MPHVLGSKRQNIGQSSISPPSAQIFLVMREGSEYLCAPIHDVLTYMISRNEGCTN